MSSQDVDIESPKSIHSTSPKGVADEGSVGTHPSEGDDQSDNDSQTKRSTLFVCSSFRKLFLIVILAAVIALSVGLFLGLRDERGERRGDALVALAGEDVEDRGDEAEDQGDQVERQPDAERRPDEEEAQTERQHTDDADHDDQQPAQDVHDQRDDAEDVLDVVPQERAVVLRDLDGRAEGEESADETHAGCLKTTTSKSMSDHSKN